MSLPAAAWYADPHDPTRIRWWDGTTWSEHVRERPEAQPTPASPAPAPTTAPVIADAVASPFAESPFAESPFTAAPVATPNAASPFERTAPAAFVETPKPFAGLPPISPAADSRPPVPPSPFGPLASASPVAPLEPPRVIPSEAAAAPEPRHFTADPLPPIEPPRNFTVDPLPPLEPIPSLAAREPLEPRHSSVDPLPPFDPIAPLPPFDPNAGDPPRTFTAPHVIPFDQPLPAADAADLLPLDTPLASGATLPPAEELSSAHALLSGSGKVSITPHTPARKLRLALVALVVIALAAGVGVLAMGQLSSITGNGGREASSAAVEVFDGDGYSFEVPKTWTKVDDSKIPASGIVAAGFSVPNSSVVMVLDQPFVGPAPDPQNPAEQAAIVAQATKAFDDGSALTLVSNEATEIGGAPGVHVVMRLTGPSGVVGEESLYAVVSHKMVLAIMHVTSGAQPDAAVEAEFQHVISSLRFD